MRIVLYQEHHVTVGRIQMVYPRHGDVFYLRALLLHGRGYHSWEDIRTIDGVQYHSFQEAARAFGLFNDINEATMAFIELLEISASPGQLRWLFCLLASEGEPVEALWTRYEDRLSADVFDALLRVTPVPPPQTIRNRTLSLLASILRGLGKSLSDINLPEPDEVSSEVETEYLQWCGETPLNNRLAGFMSSLNDEQVR